MSDMKKTLMKQQCLMHISQYALLTLYSLDTHFDTSELKNF